MQRICILALLGLPAAGKTSFSHWLLSLRQRHFNIAHICFDDFLPPHATATGDKDFDFKAQRAAVLHLMKQFVRAIKSTKTLPTRAEFKFTSSYVNAANFLIICDDNNYYRSMRYKLYQFCKQESLAYAQVYLECSLQLALSRNASRAVADRVPPHVLEQMWQRLDSPNTQVCSSWQTHTLTLNATESEYSAELIVPFLLQAFQHVLQPPAVPNIVPPMQIATALHQLDVLLRRRIKELLTMAPYHSPAAKQAKAENLNSKRKAILQDLKERGGSEELFLNENFSTFVNMLH